MTLRKSLSFAVGLAVLAPGLPAGAAPPLAVRGAVVHTLAGEAIHDGLVVVGADGKIAAVGPAAEVLVPEGARILEAAVVVPGLIDAHSVVGLAGHLNSQYDQDQLERSAAIQPELRAIDAYDARERLVAWLRGLGVTTVHTGHAPGALVSGQTMIAKTRGDTVDEAAIVPTAMVAVTLGAAAQGKEGKSPGTRAKAAAMLRAELVKAQEYRSKLAKPRTEKDKDKGGRNGKDEPPSRDLHLEVLVQVLDGTVPLLVTAERHQDIATALRLQREFGFRLVLDGAAEGYLLADAIRAAGVPVVVHPTMARPRGDRENLTMENAARLADAGILVALQSGYESYVPKTRVVLFEAAVAAAHGLGFERALRTVTLDAAKVLGIDARVGSLEVGKDGDLALYDGDPFEPASHCVATVIEGELVSEGPR